MILDKNNFSLPRTGRVKEKHDKITILEIKGARVTDENKLRQIHTELNLLKQIDYGAAALDMRRWWSATAGSYLGSVPKARILEVVREAVSPDVASAISGLKKGELVASAEQRLTGRG